MGGGEELALLFLLFPRTSNSTACGFRSAMSAAAKIQACYQRKRCKRRHLMQKKIPRAREIHLHLKMSKIIVV
jgi:hypothetical protein